MDAYGDSPPLWSQPTTTTFFYPHRRPRQPSPIFNPVILILAVPILILVILFFLVPPFISYTTQILHLNSVKKGWDSLIIVLVLFAILCGVFARINDDVPSSDAADQQNLNVSEVSDFTRPPPSVSVSSSQWYGFSDGKEYDGNVSSTPVRVGDGGGSRLSRSSSSYPDLRQESLWENLNNRFRFFDDIELKSYRTSPAVEHFHRLPRGSEVDRDEPDTPVKVIPVDKYEVSTPPQPRTPPKSPAPPQPPAESLKSRRSSRSVPKKEIFEKERNDDKFNENRSPPPPPPPPPLQPVAKSQSPEVKSEIIHRKRSGTTKEIATAITSLYSKSQRKRKKVKTRNIYDTAAALPAPPPPPPPPSKLLQNMFKKSSKNKRVHSVSNTAPPPPPPPPSPNSIFNNIFKTGSKSKRFQSSSTTAPPPPPPPPPSSILNYLFINGTKSRRFKNISTPSPSSPPPPEPRRYHSVNAGKPPKPNKTSSYYNESFIITPPSPLIPMPPPPPPFIMMETKFLAPEDFIKISSEQSSQCSSPLAELEDSDLMSVKSEGGDSIGPSVSCPSPDVNAKAESFIARHLDEWKLDKMNSIKEKRKLGFDVPARSHFA